VDRLGQPAVLVGRRGEYALIGALLDLAAANGGTPLRGEPGAGKTVLLDAAADGASAVAEAAIYGQSAAGRHLMSPHAPQFFTEDEPYLPPKIFVNGIIITNARYFPRQQFLGSP
jgi:hypothetical protein